MINITPKATSNTHNSGEQTPNSDSFDITINEELETTPFRLIGNKDKGYAIALANYRLTELQPSKEKALKLLDTDFYKIIMNMILIMPQLAQEAQQAKPPEKNPL